MAPLEDSDAIAYSEDAGYVVSALFKDNCLIHQWLTGTGVIFNGPQNSDRHASYHATHLISSML